MERARSMWCTERMARRAQLLQGVDRAALVHKSRVLSVAAQVAADASAFELLMSPSVRDQLLRDRPDAVSAALDGGHTVTFPVEFMDASDDTLLMRNLLLGISLTIRKGSTPILQYPRLSSALAPTSMVTHIRVSRSSPV